MQQHAEHAAGHDLSDPDRQHKIWDHVLDSIRIFQYKRHNQGVCQNRRNYREILVAAQKICTDSADQRRDRPEQDIPKNAARQDVGQQTADIQSRDRRRREARHNAERLGKTELDHPARKSQQGGEISQQHIQSGDDRAPCQVTNALVFHDFNSP